MSRSIKHVRTPFALFILIAICTSLTIIEIRNAGVFEFFELAAYDWTLRIQPQAKNPDPRVILVTISEEDIRTLGRWPLTDRTIAQLLEQLTSYSAQTIGLDIYRDFAVPPGEAEIKTIFQRNSNIITVMKFPSDDNGGIPGPHVLRNTDQIGFNDMLTDSGGAVRRGLLFLDNDDTTATSFALTVTMRYLREKGIVLRPDENNNEYVKLGNVTLPPFKGDDGSYINTDDSGYQFLIRYHRANQAFSHFSMSDVLNEKIPAHEFRDKIVLIGVKAESVKDAFVTPFSRGLTHQQLMPGIEVHAQMVSQLLRIALDREQPIHVLSEWEERGWIALWCMVGGVTALFIRALWPFLFVFAGWMVLQIGIAYFGIQAGWWIPVLTPILGLLTTGSLLSTALSKVDRDQRKLLMDLFSKHVSPEVADLIWQKRELILEEGRLRTQKQVVTAFFADLEGFTPIAESLGPPKLIDWLNRYMETMANVIMKNHGIVDDYYGDAIKANFGVPFARSQESEIQKDAHNAVVSALSMRNELIRLNKDLKEQSLPAVRLRIGICTGPVVAGSLGSSQRLKFTTIGDAVNVAARLESVGIDALNTSTDVEPCRILIAESTHVYVNGEWATEEIGDVKLKGREHLVKVYRILEQKEKEE